MNKLLAVIAALHLGASVGAQTGPKAAALSWLDSNASTLGKVNRNIWGWAETGLEEVKSSRELSAI